MGIKLTGLNSGLDTESIIKELMSAHSLKLTKIENKKTKNTWTQDKWKDLNTKIYALYTGDLSKARLTTSYQTKKASSSNSDFVEATATSNAAAGAHKIQIDQLASAQYVTGAATSISDTSDKLTSLGFVEGDTITIKGSGTTEAKELTIDANTTVANLMTAFKEQGVNASFDKTQKRIFLSSSNSGADQAFTLTSSNTSALSDKLGLGEINQTADGKDVAVGAANTGMTLVKAQNAIIKLDGAVLESDNNEPTINGVKYSLKQVTTSEATITVSNDTQAVYDQISSLIKGYNDILGAMNDAYYATSSKGYDPLTDEEREAMTDDQIEKWETKIKDSLLRRDSTLGSLLTATKSAMNASVTASDGKTYTLSSLGIVTSSDYTEKGLLHIKGDSEDSTYKDSDNTLMNMLETDPDLVCEIMKGISTQLYDTMTKKMSATSLSSALTFYNDKQLTKNNTQYESDISKMQDRLETLESKYYAQFTAMETAMSKLNAQQSSLSSLLGQ
ncbi:MAG: flagellar filament capping protein FliD [bacterium]|nr:flagellar filament capping protein FliD [bacterium]